MVQRMGVQMRDKLCSRVLIAIGAYREILSRIKKETLLNVAA